VALLPLRAGIAGGDRSGGAQRSHGSQGSPLLAAAGVLLLVWIYRYVSGSAPLVLDLTEAAAVTVIAIHGDNLAVVFGFVFPRPVVPGSWPRSR
jgi:hypothetical protein